MLENTCWVTFFGSVWISGGFAAHVEGMCFVGNRSNHWAAGVVETRSEVLTECRDWDHENVGFTPLIFVSTNSSELADEPAQTTEKCRAGSFIFLRFTSTDYRIPHWSQLRFTNRLSLYRNHLSHSVALNSIVGIDLRVVDDVRLNFHLIQSWIAWLIFQSTSVFKSTDYYIPL